MDLNIKLNYSNSIILIVILVIILLIFYNFFSTTIENLIIDETNIKIKTNQCDKCNLYGNQENSFLNIYKKSLNNRIEDWEKNK